MTQQLPIVPVPISSIQASNETNKKVDTLEVTIQTPKEREGTHMDSSSEKTDGWTVHRTRSGRKVGRKDGQYDPSTGKTIMWSDVEAATEELSTKSMTQLNHYNVLGINENEMQVIKSHNDALTEYVNVGAGIGGGFTNTQGLKVMKYHEAMQRCIRYLTGAKDAGLTLNPTRKWDGEKEFCFRIRGVSDFDYAKDTQTKCSISGYVVYLEDAPVMHRSVTQKTVTLSVCKAEMNLAVLCAQDMIYAKHILESLGLQVETPMVLQMDNRGAVELINSFSIGGRT